MADGSASSVPKPIIYTRWQHRGRDHSLYQVRLGDFDLPRGFTTQVVTVPPTQAETSGYRVTLWAEGDCAFASVCEDKQAAEGSGRSEGSGRKETRSISRK